jgi:hypothetical protein
MGINRKIIIFYHCNRFKTPPAKTKPVKKAKQNNKYEDLIIGLNSLGLGNIKESQIEQAIKKCFPFRADNIDEGEILKQVYCQIKAQNSTDNVSG